MFYLSSITEETSNSQSGLSRSFLLISRRFDEFLQFFLFLSRFPSLLICLLIGNFTNGIAMNRSGYVVKKLGFCEVYCWKLGIVVLWMMISNGNGREVEMQHGKVVSPHVICITKYHHFCQTIYLITISGYI